MPEIPASDDGDPVLFPDPGEDRVDGAPGATNMFPHLIDAMLEFFATGASLVPEAETIEVAAIREAAIKAQSAPGVEIPVA